MNTEIFIKRANKIHNNRYDYSKSSYINASTKVCIMCPEHGEFWQLPNVHMNGQGCPKCAGRQLTREDIIKKFIEVHDNRYDYSKFEYRRMKDKSTIICRLHGEFQQSPQKHISGQGCPICGNISKNKNRTISKEVFIERANKIHNGKFDYSKVEFTNMHDKIQIICPEHGVFEQVAYDHLGGHGCPECATYQNKIKLEDFIKRSNEIHNNKYDYSKVKIDGTKSDITVICPTHGEFKQNVGIHLKGCGCPRCGRSISKNEQEIYEFVCKLIGEGNVIRRNRCILSNNKEIDIYIPDKKIGIEYNGVLWHSEKYGKDRYYHLNKLEECNKKGIQLIQIFEDEYIDNKDIVLSKIRHLLGCDNNKKRIFARKCNVKEIDRVMAREFLTNNHIQGYTNAKLHLGCFYNNILVGVSSFKKIKGEWELIRFATDNNYVCCGIGGKMFKYFVKVYKPSIVKTFADRRWTINIENNLYTKIGFCNDGILNPEYRYIEKSSYKRKHKFNYRKKILHNKYGLPLDMTESEMCTMLGLTKVWDCGLIRYIWKNGKD